jgi:hypothetical protein
MVIWNADGVLLEVLLRADVCLQEIARRDGSKMFVLSFVAFLQSMSWSLACHSFCNSMLRFSLETMLLANCIIRPIRRKL